MKKFPFFVDISGWKIVVIGAGTIGTRRIRSLLPFGCEITVVAPAAEKEVESWAGEGKICWIARKYREEDVEGARLVLAATQEKAVNDRIEEAARKRGILFNRCDEKDACDFHFPGLIIQGDLVVGVNSGGRNHRQAAKVSSEIREVLKRMKNVETERME